MTFPQRLLIRAPNWLGDAIMALPSLAAVRAGLPETHITIAAIASMVPLFQEETAARPDDVLPIPDRGGEAKVLADGKFDTGLLLTNSFRTALTMRRAGVAERWGFATNARGFLLARRVAPPRSRIHQSVYYSRLVEALGFPVNDATPRVSLRPETTRRASEMLDKLGIGHSAVLVGFAPGAAYGHAKRWPPARVAAVIARLAQERGVTSILVGAPGDRDAGREIESALPSGIRMVNAIGRTDLRQVAGILAHCAAFVSNDSGAMHLAAALGVPVTAIFGPTDERVTAPIGNHDVIVRQVFCRPCMLRDCPIDHRCMKRITSDEVFDAVAARLTGERLRPERGAGLPAGAPARLRQGSGGQPSRDIGAKVGRKRREAAPPSESERGWGPAGSDK